jgi:hypothetical protein
MLSLEDDVEGQVWFSSLGLLWSQESQVHVFDLLVCLQEHELLVLLVLLPFIGLLGGLLGGLGLSPLGTPVVVLLFVLSVLVGQLETLEEQLGDVLSLGAGLLEDQVSQVELDIHQTEVPAETHVGRESQRDCVLRDVRDALGVVDEWHCWSQVLVEDSQ